MKQIALLLSFFFALTSFGAKAYTTTIQVTEGYSNKLFEGCHVKLTSEEGALLFEGNTNSAGILTFAAMDHKEYYIELSEAKGDFYPKKWKHLNKKKNDEVIKHILIPTPKYELEMLAIEDRIYGAVEIEIYDSLDIVAEFPGGIAAMQRYINSHVRYPKESIDLKERGKVYLEFIVETDGSLSHVVVVKGVSNSLDNEAKRVIRSMPIWTPGSVNSVNVRSRFRMPIVFALN